MQCRFALRFLVLAAILVSAWATFGCSSPMNLAVQLGYPADAKLLIVHADDLGTFHAVNQAFAQAQGAGIITSASINAPGLAFDEIAEYCRRHPEVDVGVHVTLSSEFKKTPMGPVAPQGQVPSLVNDDGFFHSWIPADANVKEVAVEIRAQIQKIIDAGITPSHIDTHMGTAFASAGVTRQYLNVAREFGLPAMVLSVDAKPVQKKLPKYFLIHGIAEMVYEFRVRGMPQLDELVADVKWDKEHRLTFRRDQFIEAIRDLKPGVTQFIIHPALKDPEMPAYDGWDWFSANRYQDYLIFTDPEVKRIIAAEGVTLISWKPIWKMFSKQGGTRGG